ncbi:hypothetical protein REPUB_Repub10bG0046700 [Reevesia pubescens]
MDKLACDSKACEKVGEDVMASKEAIESWKHFQQDDLTTQKKMCLKYINVHGNGKSVRAKVVDEFDSTMGCDSDHDYQPPCDNNIVDASKAIWKALGVPKSDWGGMDIYWSDDDD